MQPALQAFVAEAIEAVGGAPEPIVEFGSLQVEETQEIDLRPLFAGCDFTGTDFRPGPGVDRVEDLRALTLADNSVGTAICLETLEHCADPMAAGRELARVTAAGGVCLISTPFLLGIHGYPQDFFRYTPEGLREVLGAFDAVWSAGIGDPAMPVACVAVAVNGRELSLKLEDLPTLAATQRRFDAAPGQVRVGPLRYPPREIVALVAREVARVGRARLRRS